MKKAKKILWGILFLLAAVLLIAGNFFEIQVSDILIMMAMGIFLVEGIMHRNFALILFPIAIVLIINRDRLGIPKLSSWSVLAAALFGSIGLRVLFPHWGVHWGKMVDGMSGGWNERGGGIAEEIVQEGDGEKIRLENSFGDTVKYFNGKMPKEVRLDNSFGSMSVYFDNAVMQDHKARVRVDSAFGSIVLYIPAAWKVVLQRNAAFGSIKETGKCNTEGENVLEIKAQASFGEIKIKYI